MNLNIQSTSDSSKSSLLQKGSGSSASSSSEAAESKGFFATLKEAFGQGEEAKVSDVEKTKVKSEKSSNDSDSDTEIDGEKKVDSSKASGDNASKEVSSEEGEITADSEAPLTSNEKSVTGEEPGVKQTSNTSGDSVQAEQSDSSKHQVMSAQQGKNSEQNPAQKAGESADPSKVSAVMDEGNELLGRLDEANKTLQPEDGKTLPQSKGASETVSAQTSTQNPRPNHSDLMKSGTSEISKELDPTLTVSDVSKVPASGGQESVAEELAPQNVQLTEQERAFITDAKFADQKQLDALIAKSETVPLSEQELEAVAVLKSKIAAEEQILLSNELPATDLLAKQPLSNQSAANSSAVSPNKVDTNSLSNKASASSELSNNNELSSNNVAANPQEIQWGSVAAMEPKIDGQIAAKGAQGALATSVHNALNQQQAAQAMLTENDITEKVLTEKAALDKSAADKAIMGQFSAQQAMSTDANALNIAAQASGMSGKNAASQAALASALGAGAIGATRKSSGNEASDTLAQQIASASGQPGTPTPAQARAEIQAAQQAPLQLTKELANEQVQEKIQMMMSKNLKNLDIRLDPPELGRMQIRMTMNNDLANVHFTVSNLQAREIIEQTLPRLREMLAQQGLQLADSSVQQQSSGQQQGQFGSSASEGASSGFGSNNDQNGENFDADVKLDLNVATKRDGISYYA